MADESKENDQTDNIETYELPDDLSHLPADAKALLLKFQSEYVPEVYPDPMLPPWLYEPNVPRLSIGWRMGGLEQYRSDFSEWFLQLSQLKQEHYMLNNPETEEWEGYYQLLFDRRR